MFYFSIQLGISSPQLTNIFQSSGPGPFQKVGLCQQNTWGPPFSLWFAMDWTKFSVGQRVSLVLALICHSEGSWHLTQSSDRRGLKIWVRGKLPFEATMVGVDLLVTSLTPMQMEVDGDSLVFPVPVCTRAALTQVVDLCAGMGGFTAVIDRLGFHAKAGVDHNGIWRGLYQSLHEGATFHAGDLMDSVVLRELLGQGLFHGIVCSGIACQPHSVLGDRRGMSDPRAESLPKSLHLGWLLQAAVLILECTPEILRDAQAQEMLRQFCVATGYRLTQSILKLGNTWCTRRDRWIAVLTAPVVQVCELPDMPKGDQIRVIHDLIPAFTPWHQFDQDQLVLNLYELSKYYQYAAGGMDAVWIRVMEQLPTLLHSAGNQMYTCACGCRAALSEARLKQRGLVGTLIRLDTCQTHMNQCMQHARYLHPLEMWVLMGGSPKVSMGHNLRLAMSGVGQAVSPLMGLWIFAHVRQCLDRTFEVSPCQPMQVLTAYMDQVIAECRENGLFQCLPLQLMRFLTIPLRMLSPQPMLASRSVARAQVKRISSGRSPPMPLAWTCLRQSRNLGMMSQVFSFGLMGNPWIWPQFCRRSPLCPLSLPRGLKLLCMPILSFHAA